MLESDVNAMIWESSVEDSQSVSNSAEFEYISKPGETYSKGKPVAWEQRIKFSSDQCRDTCCEIDNEHRWRNIVRPQVGHITNQSREP